MELHSCFHYSNPKCTGGGDPMVLLQRKLYFSKDPVGGPASSSFFPGEGGSNTFSIKPHVTGGSRPPIPPMDPHINTEAVILIETGV